jgi:hypothetical protein
VAAHGPVRLVGPGEERVVDGRQRIDAVVATGEEARPREAAAVESPGSQCRHDDLTFSLSRSASLSRSL